MSWRAEQPLHSGRLAAVLPGLVQRVVRSRGHVWLGDRPAARLRWESAGRSVSLGDPQRWAGPAGTSLVLTGVGLDAEALRSALEECVCRPEELDAAPSWEDPFAGALGPRTASWCF